jgi:protoporphyrinogen oxidase
MNLKDHGIAIIGAGFGGFGAAYQLRAEGVGATIYEGRDTHGGHTASHIYPDGFIFDEGPHISFTEDKRLQEVFADSLEGEYTKLQSSVNNYWKGHWIKHPAQVNLNGLPTDLVVGCIKDFVAAAHAEPGPIENYEQWLHAAFGPTFAENFPMAYTRKYHTCEAKVMTTDWLGPRLYRPKLEEVLFGALTARTPQVHYIDHFRYPMQGGFVSYLTKFRRQSDVRLNHEVVGIDPATRTLTFSHGGQASYAGLISSVPLPKLIPMIKGAPAEVVDAAAKLACSEVVLVNIGVDYEIDVADHWTYFYDADIPFSRLSHPSKFSPHTAPAGTSSMQAEVYFSSKWKPRTQTPEELIEPVIRGLEQCGLIKDRARIIHQSALFAPWANVIFDLDRPRCIDIVHGYLRDVDIAYCGRFGDWAYIWTDESFSSGERAARETLERLGVGTAAT